MDHINDIFNDIKPELNNDELNREDQLQVQKLSAVDYLFQNNLENAIEVLTDIEELNEKINNIETDKNE